MANGGDPRFTTARASIEQESPVLPPPPPPRETPTANITPPRSTAPNRVNLTEENQSLLNSIRSSASLTPQEKQSLFNLMTSNQEDAGSAQFRAVVSRFHGDGGSDLRKLAVSLTSDLDHFMEMARTKNGSNRMQELLGRRDDVDIFFHNAIMRRFFHVMTDLHASRVAMQAMRVFSQAKKTALFDYVLHHAVNMACDRGGFVVLKKIINHWCAVGYFYYRDQLLYIVAQNALRLSYDAHGNYVVQHVLTLHDLRCTHNVSVSLSGHCVGLSFTKFGGYVVQKLLDTEEGGEVVVGEFLWCYGECLAQLARSEFGSFVVWKALRVMQERNGYLFWCLVNKLMPFVNLLRGRKIGTFLDSLC